MALVSSFLIILATHSTVRGVYVLKTAPGHGLNVCLVEKEKTKVTLKRKVTSSTRDIVKDCGFTTGQDINCEEREIKTVISYVPHKTVTRYMAIDCCPGWRNYKPWVGCLEFGSCVSLPQHTPAHCAADRKKKLATNQVIYTLTKPPRIPTEDPSNPQNLQNAFIFPLLNMSFSQATQLSRQDPHELQWLTMYSYILKTFLDFLDKRLRPDTHLFDKYESTSDFVHLYELVRGLLTKDGKYKEYFRYPSLEELFQDVLKCDRWKNDQVFVEQRLAGLNPMSLKRLTIWPGSTIGVSTNDIRGKLNWRFNWDKAISEAVERKTSFSQMITENSVFVIHFPYLDDLSNAMDIMDLNHSDARTIKRSTSPMAVFVSAKFPGMESYELRPVAIQLDSDNDSPVYKPSDGNKWLLAKQIFHVADFAYVEMIEHLLKTHLVLQNICLVAKRTLSEYHPLSQLLRWHCRGLFVTNVNGLPKLVLPNGYMDRLFSIGNVGAIELLNKGYADSTWEDTDFWENFKKRGVDDTIKLPYFPYRDDGYLIWKQIQSFATDYVTLYYRRDVEVLKDKELQNFANELSSNGRGKYGGIGMLRGFPSIIYTKGRLIETLTRTLWLPVQHNAVNYPIAYYGAFVPNMPTRLYDDPRSKPDEFSLHTLPDSHVATVQSVVAMSLGSLRFDKLLDYSSQMEDKDAAKIVSEHYKILTTQVKKIIDERNEKRFNEGRLTYPYLLPDWIPNSIYT